MNTFGKVMARRELLYHLKKINRQRFRFWNPMTRGICGEVVRNRLTGRSYDLMTDYFLFWPEFSGSRLCPVKHPDDGSAMAAYGLFPRWKGEYGKSRVRLLKWMIKEIKKDLKELEG